MSLDPGQMSQEEKEKYLNQKMENMRRKNEELLKRHQEIEADKKNADKLSSSVIMDEVKPYVMKVGRSRPDRQDRPPRDTATDHHAAPPPPRPADVMPARQRLSQSDAPPPDPCYRFLSDPERDGMEGGRENRRGQRERGGRGRGRRGRGGGGEACDGSGEENEKGGGRRRGGGSDGGGGGGGGGGGEGDIREDQNYREGEFEGRGGRGPYHQQQYSRGRGRGRGENKDSYYNSDRSYGRGGRGRGQDRDRDRGRQDHSIPSQDIRKQGEQSEGSAKEEDKGKGKFTFAYRDIRYFPDNDGDRGGGEREREGKERGDRSYGYQHSHDDYEDNKGRHWGRGRHSYDHRGGRGRRGRGHAQYQEYERWKAERDAIDEARLSRSRTDGGAWRREWDNDKLDQGDGEDSGPAYDPRYPRSKGEGIRLGDFLTSPGESQEAGSGQGGRQQGERRSGGGRGHRGGGNKNRSHFGNPDHNAQQEQEIMAELDPETVFRGRRVEEHGDHFTISVNTSSQADGKFVRVGSGRMRRGPQDTGEGAEQGGGGGGGRQGRGRGRGGNKRGGGGRGRGKGQGRGGGGGGPYANKENAYNTHSQQGCGGEGSTDPSSEPPAPSFLPPSAPNDAPAPVESESLAAPPPSALQVPPPQDLPTDDSWTDVTSGNESLDTSGLSQEGVTVASSVEVTGIDSGLPEGDREVIDNHRAPGEECEEPESPEEGEVYCEANSEEVEEGEILVGNCEGVKGISRALTPTAEEGSEANIGAVEEEKELRKEDGDVGKEDVLEKDEESLKKDDDVEKGGEGEGKEEITPPTQKTVVAEKEIEIVSSQKQEEDVGQESKTEVENNKEKAQIITNYECKPEEEEDSKAKSAQEEGDPEAKNKSDAAQESIHGETETPENNEEKVNDETPDSHTLYSPSLPPAT